MSVNFFFVHQVETLLKHRWVVAAQTEVWTKSVKLICMSVRLSQAVFTF